MYQARHSITVSNDASNELRLADDETFHRAVELVETLVAHAADRDYFDLARFEMELENLLRARVRVVSAGAPGARPRGPLRRDNTAA